MRRIFLLALACAALAFPAARLTEVSSEAQAALNRISPDSLRGNLSFLASDALEGRGTPSRGLDTAAEFIASRFRAAGLEPAGVDGSYFQPAHFAEVTPRLNDFHLSLRTGGQELDLNADEVRVHSIVPLDLSNAPVIMLPENGALPPVRGKIVAGQARRYGSEAMLNMLEARGPALILLISRQRYEPRETSFLEDAEAGRAPVLRVVNDDAESALAERRSLAVSVHLQAPERREVTLRNVAGILRGSDPTLRNQYILVTSHYDHLGIASTPKEGTSDRIYNGANDNGSGTVSVLEIASALASMPVHPRRSILFLTVFGEEEGLLGSYYYAAHPLVPLRDSVADINLEMMGRTDDPAGAEVGAFAFTGPSYSDLAATMTAAAKEEGVRVYSKKDADTFFDRSDNYAFALAGIVAHTILVAFDYPDYHGLADDWQKIDYANMAKVDRAVAAGILELANASAPPRWSNSSAAAPYREAGR